MKIQYVSGTQFIGSSRGHSIKIDLPTENAGTDTGLMPGELLLAALGSCMGVYIARYCSTAGIDCEGMTIDLSSEKEDNPRRIARIRASIKIPSGVPDERRSALYKAAEGCLLHETIRTSPKLTIDIE